MCLLERAAIDLDPLLTEINYAIILHRAFSTLHATHTFTIALLTRENVARKIVKQAIHAMTE